MTNKQACTNTSTNTSTSTSTNASTNTSTSTSTNTRTNTSTSTRTSKTTNTRTNTSTSTSKYPEIPVCRNVSQSKGNMHVCPFNQTHFKGGALALHQPSQISLCMSFTFSKKVASLLGKPNTNMSSFVDEFHQLTREK